MRVAFLTYDSLPTVTSATTKFVGGLNTILFNLISELSSLHSINPEVVAAAHMDIDYQAKEVLGVPVHLLRVKPNKKQGRDAISFALPELTVALGELMKREQFDLIHTAGSEAGFSMVTLREKGISIPWVHTNFATLAVRRVVVEGQSKLSARSDQVGKREESCVQGCDRVIALSTVDRDEICSVFDVPPGKVDVANPGIDDVIFSPDRTVIPGSIVVSAGRMSAVKDFPFLLVAFRKLVDLAGDSIDPKLWIIGGNDKERNSLSLPSLVERLELVGSVAFFDGVSQAKLADYFRHARVFAASSRHETFGLLPVEARACGIPSVVRTNSSYVASTEDGYGGYLVDNHDENDMGRKLHQILSLSESEWMSLSQQACDSVQKFRFSKMAAKCLEVYKQCV